MTEQIQEQGGEEVVLYVACGLTKEGCYALEISEAGQGVVVKAGTAQELARIMQELAQGLIDGVDSLIEMEKAAGTLQ